MPDVLSDADVGLRKAFSDAEVGLTAGTGTTAPTGGSERTILPDEPPDMAGELGGDVAPIGARRQRIKPLTNAELERPLVTVPKVGSAQVLHDALDVLGTLFSGGSMVSTAPVPQAQFEQRPLEERLGELKTSQPTKGEQIVAGSLNVPSRTLESLSSPKNLALLIGTAGLGEAPAAMKSFIGAAFALDTASATPQLVKNYQTAKASGDVQAQTEAAGALLVNTAMAIGVAKHAATEAGKAIAPEPSTVPHGTLPDQVAAAGAPATAEALKATGATLKTPEGAQPPSETVRALLQEGVNRPDAEALVAGTKTVKDVVEGAFSKFITPAWDAGVSQARGGHAEAWMEGYNNAIERLTRIITETPKGKEEANASSNTETAKVYGDVQPQPIEGVREVPVQEGERGIQSQTSGGIQPTPTPSSGGPGSEVGQAAEVWKAAEKRYRRALRQEPSDVDAAREARDDAEVTFRGMAEQAKIPEAQFRNLVDYATKTDTTRGGDSINAKEEKGQKEGDVLAPQTAAAMAQAAPAAPRLTLADIAAGKRPEGAGEAGAVSLEPLRNIGEATKDFLEEAPRKARAVLSQLAGKAAPVTSSLSETSGNALVHYASAKIAAPEVAKSMATEVLGDNYKDKPFAEKLGAVLVEDRLRAIRQSFIDAGDIESADAVNTIVGQDGSPLKTEADFDSALRDPAIQEAIQRHKDTVQETAQRYHEELGGKLAGPGLNTGAFVNLKAIFEGNEESLTGGGGRGNLTNPLRRASKFTKEAAGTGQQYEVDYRTIAERMIRGNFDEYAKRQMEQQLVKDGLAVIQAPGEGVPESLGKNPVKFTIERRGIPAGENKARTYIQDMWVKSEVAPELRQAYNTDGKVGNAAIVAVANFLNKIQLAGPTDAVWHTANMISSIAGSEGGKTLLADLARKLPGVNLGDALVRVTASAIRVLRDTPEIQKQIADLAEIGALRARETAGFSFNRKMIALVDRAGRLVRDDLYKNLADRGLIEPSEAGRRDWVNQMGQYNGRLMGQFQRFFKEAGFSPFVVAGRNFNRMARRRLTLDPGVEAASPAAAATMRGVEAFGTIATLFAIPAMVNYLTVGTPSGRPGVKQGQIDTGKNNRAGDPIVIDPAQWTGLRRGLRISGVQSIMEGMSRGDSKGHIAHNAIRDIIGGITHPWTGPAVQGVTTGATGYSAQGYQQSHNPYDYGENLKAALGQANPLLKGYIAGKESGRNPVAESAFALAGAGGIKEVKPFTANQKVGNLVADWKRSLGQNVKDKPFEFDDDPSYVNLRSAVRSNNDKKAKEIYSELLKTHTEEQVAKAVRDYAVRPVTGSKEREKEFLDWLGPQREGMYDAAKEERSALTEKIIDLLDLPAPKAKKRK